MNKRKARCSLDELKAFVSKSYSWAQVMRELEKNNYFSERGELQQRVKENNIDVSHFTGQGWNKGNLNIEAKLTENSIPNFHYDYLLNIREHKCEKCGLTEWLGEKIPLEVHHIDGNRRNNQESNLILLCPNCHSLTDNFRGKGIKSDSEKITEEEFVEALKTNKNVRQALIHLGLTPKGGNYTRAYELAVKYNIQHILEH